MRLSMSNFAGTARTDVAVGTLNDASILCTTRAPTPRIGSTDASGFVTVGAGLAGGCAGVVLRCTTGVCTVDCGTNS